MIGILFSLGNEIVETRINGTNVYLRTSSFGGQFITLEGLHYSKEGVVKEFPDLANDEQWKQKAIDRLKTKLRELGSEDKVAEYLIEDLKKYGYVPISKQKSGFRVEKIK